MINRPFVVSISVEFAGHANMASAKKQPDQITVEPVTTARQKRAFLKFPWKLYQNDPLWTPPLRFQQKQYLNYRYHPFYEQAEIQTFLARRGGDVVGRIAALIDHAHNRHQKDDRGMFGFFESIENQDVANALLDAARLWIARQGFRKMRGPMNPSMNYECGMLVDGFDRPATFMMTYNPAYYPQLMERFGFQKTQDLLAYWGHVDMIETLDPKLDFVAREARQRFNVQPRPMDHRNFEREIKSFMRIYNQAVLGNWGFVPMSENEVAHVAAGLKHLIVPEMTSLGEVDGRTVGIVFGILDYNQLIRQTNGRLFPFGFLKLLLQRKRIKLARMVSTNIMPEFQRWGLVLVLYQDLAGRAIKWGLQEFEFSWVLESNHLSRGSLERGGAIRQKTYRIFDYEW